MEAIHRFSTIEQARNAAVEWLEARGVEFGPHRKIEIGRLGTLAGKEVGVSAGKPPYWRLRLDYDPTKKAHFNAEVGRGAKREKAAFLFNGGQKLIEKLGKSRRPR